jgi:hypothetical protein
MAQPSVYRFPSWRRVFTILTCLWLSGSVLLPATQAQEAFTVTIGLTSVTLDTFGIVTMTGTLTCSAPAEDAWVEVYVVQPVGRLQAVYGFGYDDQLEGCDVTPHPFELVVMPENGKFVPGTAYVTLYGTACQDSSSPFPPFGECSSDDLTKPFKLKHAK